MLFGGELMPRPNKVRRVCRMPKCSKFESQSFKNNNRIVLDIEEYEAIRLMDYMGLTQEESSKQMKVSRATFQALYMDARKKISRFLVEGTGLIISGGNYELCSSKCCQNKNIKKENCMLLKGDNNMKIAVTYNEGEIFQHFGHSEKFKLYDVEDGKIVSSEIVDTNGSGHGALAGFLKDKNVNVLICGGIGGGAKNALASNNIEIYPGARGNADEQVQSFLSGNLLYNPNTECSHHKHEGEHTCGSHGCGSHDSDHKCSHE